MFDLGERIRQHVDRSAPPIDLAEIQVKPTPATPGLTAREDHMPGKRPLIVFATAFIGVLVAGVAFAQVGGFGPDEPVDPPVAMQPPFRTVEDAAQPDGATHRDGPIDDEIGVSHDETIPATDEEYPAEEPVTGGPDRPVMDEKEEPADTTPPEFAILHPEDGQRFEVEKVAFEGHAEPGARVFAGDWEADVDAEGGWRIVLILNEGQNVATLTAVDEAGNVASDTVTVHYEVPEPEPDQNKETRPKEEPPKTEAPTEEPPAEETPTEEPPAEEPPTEEPTAQEPPAEEPPAEEPPAEGGNAGEKPASVAFTAHQQFGSTAQDPPYDVFWGTATPGSTVYVVSDFGSGTTTTNAAGGWEIRVDFPSAPLDDAFNVVVESDGGRKVFSFVRLGREG